MFSLSDVSRREKAEGLRVMRVDSMPGNEAPRYKTEWAS
jgi:hypothetical protein